MNTTLPASAEPVRHPSGLKVIFLTEMWERYSYYGMRLLLVLYLTKALGYPRAEALSLYGLYTGLVYLTPLLGGYIADRWLGARLTAVIGAVVMMLGHFAMAFEPLLFIALGLLVVGNGLFKANNSSMVGLLYDSPDDPRRAGGYTIFYMSVNIGSLLAPLGAGTLGEVYGWHWGFASAGVGMALGLGAMLWLQPLLGRAGLRDDQTGVTRQHLPLVLAFCVGSLLLVLAVMQVSRLLSGVPMGLQLTLGVAAVVLVLGFSGRRQRGAATARPALSPVERQRVLAIAVIVFFVIFFWLGYEQTGGTMTLFADEQTDRHLFGWEIPATWFQLVNPLTIILLAPAFAALWTRLDRSRYALPDPAKMALGMITLGLGFVVMAVAQQRAEAFGHVGPLWLVVVYVLHTLGELMLSPVGLSLTSRLAPRHLAGLLMGCWMAATGVANYLAGSLEGLLAGSNIPPFVFLYGSSIGAGVLLLCLTPWLNRLTRRTPGEG
ncbi:MAG TPA: peptide MFS transporter [Ideonella sp.]|uniref:peptide MFS transporter n=1 Tax=Ideonella sp. TaxID=1929293 RepID=UPI002C862015|nr:peptide MFS transporter [Ideonella sp.]HSI51703.1 peptide MFS transporter [Ideonella sp.]